LLISSSSKIIIKKEGEKEETKFILIFLKREMPFKIKLNVNSLRVVVFFGGSGGVWWKKGFKEGFGCLGSLDVCWGGQGVGGMLGTLGMIGMLGMFGCLGCWGCWAVWDI
jgi:hypothetical protein